MALTENLKCNKALISIILVCTFYWIYLIFSSEMIIVFDAVGYEQLGKLIYQHGWIEFFKTGPHREPFYPWMIACSMKIAGVFSVPYQIVQKWFQVAFLLISQLLLLVLLNKLNIHKRLILATLFYFGISPAIVNSAFSLFSEIATLPFILAMVLLCFLSWKSLNDEQPKKIIFMAILTSVTFLSAVATKSAFSYVFYVCLFPFIYSVIYSLCLKNYKKSVMTGLYVVISLCLFTMCMVSYKYMNKIHNGHFQVNDRNTELLLGSALKRSQPLTPKMVLVHLSSVPGNKVCQKFFSIDECRYADWYGSYKPSEIEDLLKGVTRENRNSKIIQLTLEKIFERPFQYVFFMLIEGTKMPFWESTQVGYVDYPPYLMKMYDNTLFKNSLRLCVSLLTILSLIFLLFSLFKDRFLLFDRTKKGENFQIRLFMAVVIFAYIGMYSLCYAIVRYSLPIASLYLLSIAFCLQNIKIKKP